MKTKISYKKLWKLLIDKNMNKTDLKAETSANISGATLAKLSKGMNINTEVLVRICVALDCDITDIIELERSED